MSGVVNALRDVLAASMMEASAVDFVMIGTTHFTNAVIERRGLAQTAAVRLGLPATASLPPMVDWPPRAMTATSGSITATSSRLSLPGRQPAGISPTGSLSAPTAPCWRSATQMR